MKYIYRVPLRTYEFIELQGDSMKEVLTSLKKVHELLPTQHEFPKKKDIAGETTKETS